MGATGLDDNLAGMDEPEELIQRIQEVTIREFTP